MRSLMSLASVFLLASASVMAQETGVPNNESGAPSYRTTIEGCLSGAIGNYTLTDYSGASYQLTGNSEQLKAHVGDTVRLSGVLTPISHVPLAMSEGTQTQPTLSVSSLQKISGVCKDNNNLP